MPKPPQFTGEQIALAQRYAAATPPPDIDPRIAALVNDLIGRVADKWTMFILEALTAQGEMRFTQLSRLIQGISQKMLTQTLRHMERDGLLTRTVHPVVPPKVEYRLQYLGWVLGRPSVVSGFGRRITSRPSSKHAATSTPRRNTDAGHGRSPGLYGI